MPKVHSPFTVWLKIFVNPLAWCSANGLCWS